MKRSTLRQVNLNALPILREILLHQSIAKAADSLHLTPPALSNALRQLREYFHDDLIVRDGRKMVLTHKAEQLFVPLDAALMALQDLLSETEFLPCKSQLKFEIAMTDQAKSMLLPAFLTTVSAEAPDMHPHVIGITRSLPEDFLAGRTSFIVGPQLTVTDGYFTTAMLEQLRTQTLWTEPYVCIGRADDEDLANGLSVTDYLGRAHAVVDLGSEIQVTMEHLHLQRTGKKQNVKLSIDSYNLLAESVCATGYLALVPLSIALASAKNFAIQYVEPPIAFPPFLMFMTWRARDEDHSGLKWVRSAMARSADNLIWQAAEGNDPAWNEAH